MVRSAIGQFLCPVKSFAKTSGTITRDRTRPSFLLVSKVTNLTSPSGEALRDVKERSRTTQRGRQA